MPATHMHTHVHTHKHTRIHMHTHAHTHKHTRTHMHTHTHKPAEEPGESYMPVTHTHTHTHTHTNLEKSPGRNACRTHTHTQTHSHTNTHAYQHTHAHKPAEEPGESYMPGMGPKRSGTMVLPKCTAIAISLRHTGSAMYCGVRHATKISDSANRCTTTCKQKKSKETSLI